MTKGRYALNQVLHQNLKPRLGPTVACSLHKSIEWVLFVINLLISTPTVNALLSRNALIALKKKNFTSLYINFGFNQVMVL